MKNAAGKARKPGEEGVIMMKGGAGVEVSGWRGVPLMRQDLARVPGGRPAGARRRLYAKRTTAAAAAGSSARAYVSRATLALLMQRCVSSKYTTTFSREVRILVVSALLIYNHRGSSSFLPLPLIIIELLFCV